jgi:hypothetical protein
MLGVPRVGGAPATAPTPAPSLATFRERRDWVLREAVRLTRTATRDAFFLASACYAAGEVELGQRVAKKAYADMPNWRVRQVAMFDVWPALDLALRHPSHLDEESEAALKALVTSTAYYSQARTSNLVTLARVIRHLGGQKWGEAAFDPRAAYRKNDPDASAALIDSCAKVARTGIGEYGSRPYMLYNLMPLRTLTEFSTNPEVKRRAGIAFEVALASMAATWLGGIWGTPSGRSYPDLLTEAPSGSARLLWTYFGGPYPASVTAATLAPAVMAYEPHPILTSAATDRSKPFTARSRFWHPRQISFVTDRYVVLSEMQPPGPGKDVFQTYPHGVMWRRDDPSKHNFLWLGAPLFDGGDPKFNISPSIPHGILGTAQSVVQHQDTILFVCETEKTKSRYRYLLCFVPAGHVATLDTASQDGRLLLHYGSIVVAISSSLPFRWDPSAPCKAQDRPYPGDSEFRVEGDRFAVAMEVVDARELPAGSPYSQLQAVAKRVGPVTYGAAAAEGCYRTRNGAVIARAFAGRATVRGEAVDFDAWPMLDNPWMSQPNGGDLTMTLGDRRRHYDLTRFEVTE